MCGHGEHHGHEGCGCEGHGHAPQAESCCCGERHVSPHRHHVVGGCCCGHHGAPWPGERAFWRRFATREERLAWLERYLKDLKAEAQAVEERIAELKAQ